MKSFKKLYSNPSFNVAVTFLEPFPVGLLVTLISAAVLRKRENTRTDQGQARVRLPSEYKSSQPSSLARN